MKKTNDDDDDDDTATSTAVTVNTARENCIILNKLLCCCFYLFFFLFSNLMSIVLMTQLDELFNFLEHKNKKKDLLQPFHTDFRRHQHEVHKSK